MRKKVSYKIVLRGSRGGFSSLSKAKYYEIFYGKRKLLKKTEFHKRTKSSKQKKNFLARLIKKIEKARLEALEKAQRTRKKKAKAKKIEEARRQKIVKKEQELIDSQYRRIYVEETFKKEDELFTDESGIESGLDFEKVNIPTWVRDIQAAQYKAIQDEEINPSLAYQEPPLDVAYHYVSEATIMPFKPKSKYYDKRLIYKEIMSKNNLRTTTSTTLKFFLKDKYFIPLTLDNFEQAKLQIKAFFIPHMRDFFSNLKQGFYILRVTFRRQVSDKMIDQGISDQRQFISNNKLLVSLLNSTLKRFIDPDQKKGTRAFIKNYLQETAQLTITGFTLEHQEFDKIKNK